MQVEVDDCTEFFSCGLGSRPLRFFQIGDQAVEGAVLAEKEKFVFAAKIVVEVGRGEVGGGGDFTHAGFGEAASAEFAAGGAEDFQASGEVAALEAGGAQGDRMALGGAGVNTI